MSSAKSFRPSSAQTRMSDVPCGACPDILLADLSPVYLQSLPQKRHIQNLKRQLWSSDVLSIASWVCFLVRKFISTSQIGLLMQ